MSPSAAARSSGLSGTSSSSRVTDVIASTAIALADDEITEEENEFINQLAEWFGIVPERAAEILDQLEEDKDE